MNEMKMLHKAQDYGVKIVDPVKWYKHLDNFEMTVISMLAYAALSLLLAIAYAFK